MSVGFKPPFGRAGPRSGNFQAYWIASDPSSVTSQRVDVSAYASEIDAGSAWLDATGWLIADDYRAAPPWDQFYMQVRFFEGSGIELNALRYDTGVKNVPTWGRYGVQSYKIPLGVRSVEIRFNTWEVGYDAGVADDFSVKVYTLPKSPVVLVTAPSQTKEEIAQNGFRLSFSANVAGEYVLESSVNLLFWEYIASIVYTNGTVWVFDPVGGQFSSRFYRARPL